MPRAQGCAGAAMDSMYGMPRAQGCAGAAMYRMYGMPRAQGCAGAAISRLVALVPKPRVNLTRFHGVFAPNSKYRAKVLAGRWNVVIRIQAAIDHPVNGFVITQRISSHSSGSWHGVFAGSELTLDAMTGVRARANPAALCGIIRSFTQAIQIGPGSSGAQVSVWHGLIRIIALFMCRAGWQTHTLGGEISHQAGTCASGVRGTLSAFELDAAFDLLGFWRSG